MMDMYMCIEISMSDEEYDYHSRFMEHFKYSFAIQGDSFENAISVSHEINNRKENDFLKKRLLKEQRKNDKLGLENDELKQKLSELESYKTEHDKYEEEFQEFLIKKQEEEKLMKSINNEHNILLQFLELCEWVDNMEEKGVSLAPTEFEDIFYHYKMWCQQEAYKPPDKKTTKAELLMIQKNSIYGLEIGKRSADKCPNGTELRPRFNLWYEPE